MSRRIRPSARKKTLHNVMHSNLSITDKGCIDEVFAKFEQLKADKEALIAGQKTLQKALAKKNAEIERLKLIITSNPYCVSIGTADIFTENHEKYERLLAKISAEAIKEFAEKLCEGRVPNDPVVIAVKVELKMMANAENTTTTEKE